MSFLSNRKKIIQILFGLALLLLITDIIIEKIYYGKPQKIILSNEEIHNRFFTALHNLGIKDEWIIRSSSGSKNNRQTADSYKINIPRDLSLTVVLSEIFSIYNDEVQLSAQEKVSGGKTILKISSQDQLIINSEFIYNDKIFRKAGKAGFLILDFENIVRDSLFVNFTESFGVVVVPSKASSKEANIISGTRKEYIIYLNDEIKDLDYRLSEDYPEARLKNSVRSIVGDFSKAVFILVDDKSDLFRSKVFHFIEEEFNKRKIKMIRETALIKPGNKSEEKLLRDFRDTMENKMHSEGVLVLISSKDFLTLIPEITRYRKIGYKFINPSDIIFNTY